MRMTKLGGALLGAVFGVLAAVTAASAQDAAASYPNKPIRVIVPFAAGGGNDIFARLVGQKLSEILGQPVINENKPGAGGRIAAEYVMNQPHDGYTLFIGASGVMSIAAAAYPNLSYHPTKTFIPLSMIANFPLILVVPPDHPIKNVKELVEWAKKNPDKSNYASTSPAFTTASELLKLKSGMPGQMIPYKSSNEMILSVMQGQTLFAISDGPPAIPQIKAGKVRALAVTGSRAFGRIAGCAEHDGGWIPRGQHQAVQRLLRGGGHAAGDRRQARGRIAEGDQGSGRELEAEGDGGHAGRQSVGRFPRDDRQGHQDHFRRDQGGESEVRQLAIRRSVNDAHAPRCGA